MDGPCDNKSGVLCCFCNQNIAITNVDPCDINILTNWDKSKTKQNNQTFWCHLECFRNKMHENMKIHLVVDILSCDDEDNA
ncbi:MAG TPA: hypothetical protein VGW78_04440 [Candidatus Babeliales bacterium]|jgi:hypothetical protein|nr:hypothetical protein [Candidatus Babeliales bacterium]